MNRPCHAQNFDEQIFDELIVGFNSYRRNFKKRFVRKEKLTNC